MSLAVGCWQSTQELLLDVGAESMVWSQVNLNTGRLCLVWWAVTEKLHTHCTWRGKRHRCIITRAWRSIIDLLAVETVCVKSNILWLAEAGLNYRPHWQLSYEIKNSRFLTLPTLSLSLSFSFWLLSDFCHMSTSSSPLSLTISFPLFDRMHAAVGKKQTQYSSICPREERRFFYLPLGLLYKHLQLITTEELFSGDKKLFQEMNRYLHTDWTNKGPNLSPQS